MAIFLLFELLFFIAQKGVFSFQNIVKDNFLFYIEKEIVFYDILERKNAFLGYKKKKFKKQKNGHFSTFIVQAIQAMKMPFMIFQKKKRPFQAIKTGSSKSRKMDIFPNGLTHGFGLKMVKDLAYIAYIAWIA